MAAVTEDVNIMESATAGAPKMFEEDGNSRDSGVSVASCGTAAENNTDFSKVEQQPRIALTDCANFVAKVYNSSVSSSRSSSFYNCDTPTGRKTKSVFYTDTDSLDRSQYDNQSEKQPASENHRKRSSTSMSPTYSLMERKRSRNLSIAAPQSDRVCRYNGLMHKNEDPFADEDDDLDEVFETAASSIFVAPAPRSAASCWDLKQPSDSSANSSFLEKTSKPLRTMSMGVIEQETNLPSMLDVKYSLPGVEHPQNGSQAYRSISAITLLSEFQRLGDTFNQVYVLVDCRYPYEFIGGHVRGAINLYKPCEIKSRFFPDVPAAATDKRIPIFYCEYSQKRGPKIANTVRSIDRVRNELRYPHVEYPEMYLLDHGYKALWSRRECRQICEPCNYVPMDHKQFTKQLKTAKKERHQSNASIKPNGETDAEEKWSMRTRRSFCRTSSVLSARSLQSKLSQSSDTLSGAVQRENDFFFNAESKKSLSTFDIQSIDSEIDVDFEVLRRKTSITSIASSINYPDDRVVQLGFRAITPDFPLRPPQSTSTPPTELHESNTPRAFLDFTSVSDTE